MIKVGKAEELLEQLDRSQLRPVSHCFHLGRIHLNTSIQHNETKERNCGDMELTFYIQLILQ